MGKNLGRTGVLILKPPIHAGLQPTYVALEGEIVSARSSSVAGRDRKSIRNLRKPSGGGNLRPRSNEQ